MPETLDLAVIETARARILPFSEEHLTARYVGWLNDPEVVRYSEQRHRRHSLESGRNYWLSFRDSPNGFWAIVLRDPQWGHIGNITAYVDMANGVADVGILIGEKQIWGQGYGTETWRAVCSYLLLTRGLRKITAGTMAVNRPMLRIMKSAGMKEECRRIRQFLFEGREVDGIYSALFREDLYDKKTVGETTVHQ